jgi:DNA-binding transcriptional LysR family regulator
MTLLQLKYAIAVAEMGTLIEAAKSLYVSQPSLSFAVKALEEELGVQIFERSKKGMVPTREGGAFLRDAREIVQKFDLLRESFSGATDGRTFFSVSSHHYTFVAEAFSELVKRFREGSYEFSLRESKTLEIIDDVKTLRSEVGVIHINAHNEAYIGKLLNGSNLAFDELFVTYPYILVGEGNPLAKKNRVGLSDIKGYPCVSFMQDELSPDWMSEEVINVLKQDRSIRISDKGSLANLLIATDAYVVSTGVYMSTSDDPGIVAIPLHTEDDADNTVHVGVIRHKHVMRSEVGKTFCEILSGIAARNAPRAYDKRYF